MEESHFLDMMRAVQPHVSGRRKRSIDLMIQSASLLSSVHHYQEPVLSACDASSDSIDLEAVFMDLQPVCNPAEAELVNLILNFFRSRKIYAAYQSASQQPMRAGQDMFLTPPSAKEGESRMEDGKKRSESEASELEASPEKRKEPEKANKPEQPDKPPEANRVEQTEGLRNQNVPQGFHGNTPVQNLMENQALQSLLSPSQKENLNRIGTLMQVLS